MASLLHVTSEKSQDAAGQTGIYTGQVRVDSGKPEGKGIMEYSQGPLHQYDGDWSSGLWEGQGTCTLKNGDEYKGEFVQHERHGNGAYTWASSGDKQRVYQGMFHHNQRHGHGKYTWKNLAPVENSVDDESKAEEKVQVTSISTYVGMFDNGQREGHGVYASAQIQYAGEWQNGQYHGYGVLESANRTYRGYFQHGHKGGRGVEISKEDGSVIHEGQWANDQPVLTTSPTNTPSKILNPQHTIVLRNPEPVIDGQGREGLYKGILQDNLPQGVGTMSYKQHPELILEYEGFWQEGIKHGFGRVAYMTGDSYQGHLEKNLRQGQGELTMADGRHYKGHFQKNLPHAKENFRVIYPKNDMYLGGYDQGQRSGFGRFVWNDGGNYQGEWTDGVYCGKGDLVTSNTIYKGDFTQGMYHGIGCLTNLKTDEVIFDGEWKDGLPVAEDDTISNLLLTIPQPPLDYDVAQSPMSSAPDSYPAPQQQLKQEQTSLASSILEGLSSLVMSEPIAPASPKPVENSQPKTLTTPASPTIETPDMLDREACKAVVDMSLWDGQENPGRYTGIVHVASRRPHGVGRMVYDDGNRVHEGFWENGHRQGHGRCLFVQIGDFHEGNYHQNLRQGPGTYYWKDGRQFVGHYEKDERQGAGKFTYPNGDVFQGNFESGLRSGSGVFTFHNKTCQYRGEWDVGMYSGKGVLRWQSTREFRDSTIRQTCEHRYEGRFVEGLFSGEGVEYENDKIIRQGIWSKGNFIDQQNEDDAEEIKTDEQSSLTEQENEDDAEEISLDESLSPIQQHNEDDGQQISTNQSSPTEQQSEDPEEEEEKKESSNLEGDENDDSALRNITRKEPLKVCASSIEQTHEQVQWKRSRNAGLAGM